jgi:pseudouridine kinase
MAAVLCIGAAHLDRKARALAPVVLGSSNPAETSGAAGGVARNVAEGLARLGLETAVLSRVGRDAEGDRVLRGLAEAGVGTDLVTRSDERPTAGYTALLDPAGELAVAFADMAVYDELTPALLAGLLPEMARFPTWFVDCNLPRETLAWLLAARPPGTAVLADAVSVPKAGRLDGLLGRVDTVFANTEEAARLAGLPIRSPLDVCAAGARLLDAGAGGAVITRGPEGAFLATDEDFAFLPALPAERREVTGAGDAVIAGFIWGRHQGRGRTDALRIGLACAAMALETPDAVSSALDASRLLVRAEGGRAEGGLALA